MEAKINVLSVTFSRSTHVYMCMYVYMQPRSQGLSLPAPLGGGERETLGTRLVYMYSPLRKRYFFDSNWIIRLLSNGHLLNPFSVLFQVQFQNGIYCFLL